MERRPGLVKAGRACWPGVDLYRRISAAASERPLRRTRTGDEHDVSLGDVPEQAGPLRLLRGSHRRHAGWRERGLVADDIVAAHPEDVVTCPVRVGDVVAHHLAVIHGTGPNRSAVLRRSWALRCAGDGVRFVLPAVRAEEREWFGLEDGEPLGGPRFPLAWPPVGR